MRGTTNANYRFGETVGSGYVTVYPIQDLTANGNDGHINLSWSTPPASAVTTLSKIDIRYKAKTDSSTYFSSITDGTLAVSLTDTSTTSYTITDVTAGQEYLVSVVAWGYVNEVGTSSLVPATSAEQIVSATPSAYKTWTVVIDESNSNPLSCCTYADDAAGMTKGSSDWDEIFGYKPCVFYQGAVYKYLNPNDFTKFADGTDATSYITDSNLLGYDVMIEFPRMGLTMSKSGTQVTISLTNNPNDSTFEYRAHKRGDTQKNAFYLGAYDADDATVSGITSDTIGSVSGKSPLVARTLAQFIGYAHLRGTGYEIMAFYQWTYIQCLYVLKYGNLNSQASLGQGYVGGSRARATGTTNTKGMCYGSTSSSTDRVKLFGLEDAWGNVYQWLGGLYTDPGYTLFTTTDNFGTNASVTAWEYNVSSGVTAAITGYISKVQGTNSGGFVVQQESGSASTYFTDAGNLADGFPVVGGGWGDGGNAGVFYCYVYYSASHSSEYFGSRLMYL